MEVVIPATWPAAIQLFTSLGSHWAQEGCTLLSCDHMLAVLRGFHCYWNCTLLLENSCWQTKTTKIKATHTMSCWWVNLLLVTSGGYDVLISGGREKDTLSSVPLVWSNPILEGRLVICQSKILFLSPQLRWNTWIDMESRKGLTHAAWYALGSAKRTESACKAHWIVRWLTGKLSCFMAESVKGGCYADRLPTAAWEKRLLRGRTGIPLIMQLIRRLKSEAPPHTDCSPLPGESKSSECQ